MILPDKLSSRFIYRLVNSIEVKGQKLHKWHYRQETEDRVHSLFRFKVQKKHVK